MCGLSPGFLGFTSKGSGLHFWLKKHLHDQLRGCLFRTAPVLMHHGVGAPDLLCPLTLFSAPVSPEAHSHCGPRGLLQTEALWELPRLEQTFKQDYGGYEMSCKECEMKNLQSIPSSGKHAHVEVGGAHRSLGTTAGSQLFIWACITRW